MVKETWPPRDAAEMQALQARYGTDAAIADVVGRSQNAVSQARQKLGVPVHRTIFWTETRIEVLTELWGKGFSANQIAERIGDGCSRNAVIGKAHRLGLPSRPSPINRTGNGGRGSRIHRRKRQQAAEILSLGKRPDAEPEHGRIDGCRPLAEVSGPVMDCQWIEGDPRSGFCGKRSRPGKPYCADHCDRAYMTLKSKVAA